MITVKEWYEAHLKPQDAVQMQCDTRAVFSDDEETDP